jgi:hypothetical protein
MFSLGRWLAPVKFGGQIAEQTSELRPGRRIEMLDTTESACKLFDVASGRGIGCLARCRLFRHSSVLL